MAYFVEESTIEAVTNLSLKMGKINKKLIKNTKKSSSKVVDLKKKFNIKDCFVKLNRIEVKRDERIELTFNLKIRKNVVQIGKKKLFLSDPSQKINVSLGVEKFDIVVKCCNIVKLQNNNVKSLNDLIDAAWRKVKKENRNNEIHVGDIVLGKMKGFKPWPARVESFTKTKTSSTLYFFGTHNRGPVAVSELVAFNSTHEVIRLMLLRIGLEGYHKGIIEAEKILGVPEDCQ